MPAPSLSPLASSVPVLPSCPQIVSAFPSATSTPAWPDPPVTVSFAPSARIRFALPTTSRDYDSETSFVTIYQLPPKSSVRLASTGIAFVVADVPSGLA